MFYLSSLVGRIFYHRGKVTYRLFVDIPFISLDIFRILYFEVAHLSDLYSGTGLEFSSWVGFSRSFPLGFHGLFLAPVLYLES